MRSLIVLIITALFWLSSCSDTTPDISKKYYKTYSTQTGNISIQDDVMTTIEGAKTSDLTFRTAGIITDIHVRPGEIVKKWQILARLGNRESLIQAWGFTTIEQEMQKLWDSTSLIGIGTESIQKATAKLYDERLKWVDLSITVLENTIAKAKQDLDNKTIGLQGNFDSFSQDFDRISTSMLYEWDKILGITTNFESQAKWWEPYLGARVGTSQADAENKWNTLYALRGKIRAYTETWGLAWNIETKIQDLKEAYLAWRAYSSAMNHMLQNSIVWWGLATETLDGWINLWGSLMKDAQGSEANYITWTNTSSALTKNTTGSGTVAEKDVTSLSLELENLRQTKQTLLAEKISKLEEIKTNRETIQSKKWEISVQIAQTQLSNALAKESSYYNIITAPYDGVILEKYLEEWMLANGGTRVITMTSTDAKIIKTYIENTLYLYKKWDTIIGIKDGTNDTYTWVITLIQEQKDPLYNKNYLEIQIEGDIAIGEKVIFHFERKKASLQNGVLIPLSSIITRYGPPGVYVLVDNIARFHMIEILGSDMSHAEVIGIPEGATIITEWKDNIYDGEKLE